MTDTSSAPERNTSLKTDASEFEDALSYPEVPTTEDPAPQTVPVSDSTAEEYPAVPTSNPVTSHVTGNPTSDALSSGAAVDSISSMQYPRLSGTKRSTDGRSTDTYCSSSPSLGIHGGTTPETVGAGT